MARMKQWGREPSKEAFASRESCSKEVKEGDEPIALRYFDSLGVAVCPYAP